MVSMKVLNIYKLNIYQILNLMFKIKANTAPSIFQSQFTEIQDYNYYYYPIQKDNISRKWILKVWVAIKHSGKL